MYKACSKCGKIHDTNYRCYSNYGTQEERKLRSKYAWYKKSQEIREAAQYLCEVCRDQGVYTYDNLEVHHIVKLRENKQGLLNNYNLICLCTAHHKQADSGELSRDYLTELAIKRESKG